ncbi:iron-sulfur cluster biosynthesis family protein [Lacticaseibacillus hulanensis]|uniref:iron-sulfur cluster biosynthesis family protein n=1 Tax=Lacticaseibacillus hulanensis TaxID=2493111 RepID=UPI000FDC3366|nr:iron-sulfur cluster biosynthesis family protein [Lacticaseibacillus hulanensis]
MAQLRITPEAAAKIQTAGSGYQMVLDYDDGVGPFSAVGVCSLNLSFNLILTPKENITSDFNTTIDSTLGPVYVKDYSAEYFDDNPVLKVGFGGVLALANDSGLVDGAVELRVVDQVAAKATVDGPASC